ncbi:hypothetical protein STRTUCAR8_06074 [Streptomyces turgidiscabies Car8]|uniref:Uncharacterized protein n=1 Tax=Streptomyces turgidiscabies (strain Car8) TaxID=698760 RepID=L7EYB3_STRT8|nr:hypothetical protein STRTUCAR8_06074 [Streptomyces turgidiscabies Car8]
MRLTLLRSVSGLGCGTNPELITPADVRRTIKPMTRQMIYG